MIGTKAAPSLSLKAQESKWFTYFMVDTLDKYNDKIPDGNHKEILLAAGRALVTFSDALDSEPRHIPVNTCKKLQDLADLHVGLCEQAGVNMYPKHHMFRHLAAQIRRKGNPRYYNTYWDESVNGVVADLANTTHRARFERMTFRKYGYLKSEGPPGTPAIRAGSRQARRKGA
eukprot:4461734-Pyramimonas_sp.AAC.1